MEETVREIHFNALPEATRTRFVACLNNPQDPAAPLLSELAPPASPDPPLGLVLSIPAGLLGLAIAPMLAKNDYGSTYTPVQGPLVILAYLACAFAIVYAALRAAREVRLRRPLPFPRGRYLLPGGYVDARTAQLVFVPIAALRDAYVAAGPETYGAPKAFVGLEFDGIGRVTFAVRDPGSAAATVAHVRAVQQAHAEATRSRDGATLETHDVFASARAASDWPMLSAEAPATAPRSGPRAPQDTPLFRRAALVAFAAATVVSVPFWWVRDFLSDESAFADLPRCGSTGIEFYIDRGGHHAAEARAVLLPAAQFAEAQQGGSASALRRYLQRHPDSPFVAQARAAIHAYYAQAEATFAAQASTRDPRLLPVMHRLLAYLEANNSPPVRVRFYAPSSEVLERVDAALATNGARLHGRRILPIAPHFGAVAYATHESGMVAHLQEGFDGVMPRDVLILREGERLQSPPATVTEPVIEVSYEVMPSGELYVPQSDPSTAFVGITVAFAARMRVPGAGDDFTFAFSVEPPEHFSVDVVRNRAGGGAEGMSGAEAYDAMGSRAFDQFSTRMRETFFRSAGSAADPSAAPSGAAAPKAPGA